jgi:hypothetical protein
MAPLTVGALLIVACGQRSPGDKKTADEPQIVRVDMVESYWPDGAPHMIRGKLPDRQARTANSVVLLDDDSIWLVHPEDRHMVFLWEGMQSVLVTAMDAPDGQYAFLLEVRHEPGPGKNQAKVRFLGRQ